MIHSAKYALLLFVISFAAFSYSPSTKAQDSLSEGLTLQTVAESSDFEDTAHDAQVEYLLRALAAAWDRAELIEIGQTVEGRALWALVVEPWREDSNDATNSDSAATDKPLTVILLGGIHSGECDGKEALLALARDMLNDELTAESVSDETFKNLRSLRLVFIPNFNADANERRGLTHRPGQAGPAKGMGVRENAQDLDLNRDFIKLESPEVRSLVAAMNRFDVDVLIDTHTTNGSLHQYPLTYDIPHHPATPRNIDNWLRESFIPELTRRVSNQGFETFYYGNFNKEHTRWDTYGYEPRYSTEYMGLRGRIGILAESYSYASYETRINASYAFVKETLNLLASDQAAIRAMISARGDTTLPLRGEITKTTDNVLVKGYATKEGQPPKGPYGPDSAAEHVVKDYRVQLWNSVATTYSVELPVGYIIPKQYAWAASRLMLHGAQVSKFTQDVSLDGENLVITKAEKLPRFQGHELWDIETKAVAASVHAHAGDFWVGTDHPLGRLAAYLLEPSGTDSLAAWNFLDPDIAPDKNYPIARSKSAPPSTSLEFLSEVPATERITLEHLMEPGNTVSYGGGFVRAPSWLKSSSEYVVSKNNRAYAVDAATGSMRVMSELDVLKAKLDALEAFTDKEAESAAQLDAFSDDWKFALVNHKNDLYFFDADNTVARQLTHSPEKGERMPTLSPTGQHVAYVNENDLWVVDCNSTEARRLTDDGSEEKLNGVLDWVYQEELYGRGNFKAFWWSPDGSQLAFLRLDQTPVPSYQVSDSISFSQSLEATRYPKAGQPLPHVEAWIVDVATGAMREIDLSQFAKEDRLVGRVSWSPAGEVWLQVYNRVQNKLDVLRVNPNSGQSVNVFTEVSPGWIEVRGTPKFLPGGDFLWLSDLPNGHTHLYRINASSGERRQLTQGDWDVSDLHAITPDGSTAFVSGNPDRPINSQLLSVNTDSGEMQQLTAAPGVHRVSVNATGEYFTDVFSSLTSPPFASVNEISGKLLRVVDAGTSDRYQYLDIATPQLTTIVARDGVELQTMIMLPPSAVAMDGEDTTPEKLPVLFHVYGGPQNPTIRNAWQSGNYWWHQMLCEQGYAVVLCDNRAALGRGVKDTWTIRGDMGRVELQDLEDAVTWVSSQPWADPERIGVWGWSYGGYFTSYAMTHSKLFRAGIAGAPVTDWRNYDAIYTERYMDLPQNNEAGYKSSSVVEAAKDLSGNLLIIHGERDDNVHISNTLQLVYALQKADKQFDLMIYPKNRHGVVDPQQRYHMYRMMTDFLDENLKGSPGGEN